MEIQTRSEENGLHYFKTLKEAFAHADVDITVWKVSFHLEGDGNASPGERVRLVRDEDGRWMYDSI